MVKFSSFKVFVLSISLIFFGVLIINLIPFPINFVGLIPILIAFVYPVKSTLFGPETTPPPEPEYTTLCTFYELKKKANLTDREEKKAIALFNNFFEEVVRSTSRVWGQEKTVLVIEPIFRSYMFHWLAPCTDSTFYSARCLNIIKKDFVDEHKDKINNFIINRYDRKQKGFINVPKESPTLYPTSTAIATLKTINGIDMEERLVTNGNPTSLKKEDCDTINAFIQTCRKDSYFLNSPHHKESYSLWSLWMAYRILWNLNMERVLVETKGPNIVESFIKDCLTKEDESCWGFSPRPSLVRGVCPTFFAIHFLSKERDKARKIEEFYDEIIKNSAKFINFLNKCWNEKDGAFSSVEGGVGSLHAVYYAIRMADILGRKKDVLNHKREPIERFIETCRCHEGGFSLRPGDIPTAFATRMTVEISSMLDMTIHKKWDKEISKFIVEGLYDEEEGAFSGVKVKDEDKDLRRKVGPHIKNLLRACPVTNFQIEPAY